MAADTLTIVHMNDTHSNLAPGGRRNAELKGTLGGIARAASFVGYMKLTQPNVVTVHGGDMFIGDLFFQRYFGIAELRILGAMGLDVMTLGNHEFDLTPQTLITAYDTAFVDGQLYPIVSANVVMLTPPCRNSQRTSRHIPSSRSAR
jgi:2',3'-cyclic-nucleotide 2'-phosphodiesterase (5'-nucleotidase family)